ncbi:MAG TPA: cytochrome P450 [Pseudonocardiaceae bacterium]
MSTVTTVSLRGLLSRQGRRDPYPFYAELHRNGPVCRLDGARERFDLVVHGYDAVNKVLRDPAFRVVDAGQLDARGVPWRHHEALRTLTSSIFFTDGPDWRRVRRLFAQVFTPQRVVALRPAIVRITEALLDRMAVPGAGGDPVDLMAEFALPLPSNVIGELLGVAEEDRPWFPPRVRAFGAILDLNTAAWRDLQAADRAAVELTDYFTDLVARRRVEPRDDLVSALVRAQGEGLELPDAVLVANLITLFNAGFVTTTHLIGNGLTLLLDRPGARAAVLGDEDGRAAVIEEILRHETIVQFTGRWAAEDTEVMGVPVPAGSRVLVLYGAANRDPARFTDPDVFDPARPHHQHTSFGGGPHYCLGAALSRHEAAIALPMLLRRFPRIAVAGPPGERDKLVLRGYDSLPVTVT